jgi:hypothetical protein
MSTSEKRKSLRISLTKNEYATVVFQAKARGLSPSAYLKTALFSYNDKYPSKGLMAVIAELDGIPNPAP